ADDPDEQADEQDQRERTAQCDVADPVPVLRETACRLGHDKCSQTHHEPTTDAGDQDASDEPGDATTGDLAQDLVRRHEIAGRGALSCCDVDRHPWASLPTRDISRDDTVRRPVWGRQQSPSGRRFTGPWYIGCYD